MTAQVSPDSHSSRVPSRLGRFLRKAAAFLLALVMGIILSVLVFLALPFLQKISEGRQDQQEIVEAPTLDAPETPELEEPPPPPPPPEEQEPEPEMEPLEQLSLAQLTDALDGSGMGGGAVISGADLMKGAQDAAKDVLENAGLDKQPEAMYQPAPRYPPGAGGIDGSVTVQFVVDARGNVTQPQIVTSTAKVFEQPALSAVQKWRFKPGERGGQPAPFKMKVPIRFTRG